MADTKITALTAISTVDPAVDVLPIVDVSDTTMAASGTTKKITSNQILGAGGTATLASATITGDLTVDTNTFYVKSSTNQVGIGTTSPNANFTLDLTSSNDARARQWFADVSLVGTGDLSTGFQIRTLGTGTNGLKIANAGNTVEWLRIDSNGVHTWQNVGGVAGTAMTLNSTGLGVGVTPSAWSGYKAIGLSNQGCNLYALNASSTSGLTSNGYYNGTNWLYINSQASGRYEMVGAAHSWYTSASGTAGNAITFTQAMTLDASGNLLVGKTAGYGTGESNTLQLKSFLVFAPDDTGSASNRNWLNGANGSAAGSLDWTVSSANNNWPNFAYRMQLTSAGATYNTTGTWGTISDARLKENISDARNYLADLLKLRVVKYSLKEESSEVATKLGFIAQEVEQVFPNMVEKSDKEYEGGEGIRTVKTTVLIPMLLKAIQELTARVEALEA